MKPYAEAYNDLTLFAVTEVNGSAPGSDGAVIEARHVNINSFTKQLDVYALTYAKGAALGGDVDSKAFNEVHLDSNVTVPSVVFVREFVHAASVVFLGISASANSNLAAALLIVKVLLTVPA